MKRLLCALTLASLPAILAAQAPAAAPVPADRLNLDLYWDYETVADPQISPDGTQIIYTRQWFNKLNDRRESSLWMMNADGTRNRFLTQGGNARWSPTGDRILYTAQGDPKGTQIFVRYMDAEGPVSQITRVEQSPANASWSPDGTQIAFTMPVVKKNTWPIKMSSPPEGGRWTEGPRIVERPDYRQDREGFNDDRYGHIFVVPATGGTARQLTTGNWNHTGVEWTPDSKQILFASLRVEDADRQWRETDIYTLAVANGEIKPLTQRKGPDGNPAVSPDGKLVAYTGYDWTKDTYIDSKIYVMNIDGSNPHLVSGTWDRTPQNLIWKSDGSGVYFSASSEGTENFYFLPISGAGAGTVRQVTEGTHMLNVSTMTKSGKVAAVLSAFQTPPDVVSFDVNAPRTIKTLTAVNADILAGKKLGEVKEITFTGPEALKIQGWYITPPDFNPSRKYPMQLHIHGGPHGMYGVGFNFGWQEQAANDYVILYLNPRGSSGYGSAFGNKIMRAYPSKDFDDLMAGVDELLKKGFVDERNMFVTGCSGGGVLTAWVVGHTDRFAAASSNCPVIDWVSFVGTTDGIGWYRNFEKLPWEDPSEHIRRSPLTYVGNVKTPTMLMTGELDLRTPMPQTEQFYSALAYLKVPTAMVRFVNEYHGTTSTPSNFIRTQLILRYWFEKHSRPMRTTSTAGQQ